MKFHIGQEVLCIATGDWSRIRTMFPDTNVPKRGRIYTVRETRMDRGCAEPGILLREIVNAPFNDPRNILGLEFAWCESEFVPVDKRKTDISIFERMLEPKPHQVDA